MPLGGVEIDQLASELGLRAVNGLSLDLPEGPTYAVTLCLDELVNTPAASEAFDALPGVIYAEPNYRIGDGPDTAVEKLRDDWHVVIRDAKGDCPAGCIEQRLYFFVVTPDSARQLPEAEAAREPILKGLAETWSR
jgi:hypothetical protein